MKHSTFTVSTCQYLHAFDHLFPQRLLQRAVQARRRRSRNRKLPLPLLLGLLLTWFFKPQASLTFLLHWFLPAATATVHESALYRARQRLGWAPLRWLRRHVLRPLACCQRDGYAFYHGRRLLALDGTTFTVADTAANQHTFGRPHNQHGGGGYPLARVVALCEVGTHALLDWIIRSYRRAEVALAGRLLPHVPRGSLLLADRNFHSFVLWQQARTNGHDLLIRVQKGPKWPIQGVLKDGSFLSRVRPRRGKNKKQRAIRVRVIRYQWTDEQGRTQPACLLTSLLEAERYPAAELMALYHQRWEQELVFGEIKGQLWGRAMHIRAQEPLRVCQEIEALLLGHYTLRWVMLQAARQAKVAAVALSLRGSLRVLEVRLARVGWDGWLGVGFWQSWWEELLTSVGQQRLRGRRRRRCPRARKVTRSHWPVKKGQKEGTIPKLEIVPATDDSSP